MKIFLEILIGLVLVALFLFLLFIVCLENTSGKDHKLYNLIENYEEKSKEIAAIKNYVKQISPEYLGFLIEFNTTHSIKFHVWEKNDTAVYGSVSLFHELDINPFNNWQNEKDGINNDSNETSFSFNEIIVKLNWTDQEFREIQKLLERANCISVSTPVHKDVFTIGFQTSWMGKYSYTFVENENEEEIKRNIMMDVYTNTTKRMLFFNLIKEHMDCDALKMLEKAIKMELRNSKEFIS